MLLSARDLRKVYTTPRGPIAAVDGIDLDVEAGEFVAIRGRSGSGKSTLLGILGGLCRPTSGSLTFEGTDLGGLGASDLADFRARRFGFVFQFSGLLPNLRAADNVALPALLRGVAEREAYDRARDLLGQVGLAERWDAYPGELSGGQHRRIAVARALINGPSILLADEPTNDLDEQAEREILGLLRGLRETHRAALVIVTHDPELAGQADRVIHLASGKVVSAGRPVPSSRAASGDSSASVPDGDHPATPGRDTPFEPGPVTLAPAEPTPLGAGLGRFLFEFAGWVALAVGALFAFDSVSARLQGRALEERAAQRKKSEDLALQQLRADIDDVTYEPDGGYRVGVYLQNFSPERPFYVLGPSIRAFVQVDRTWQPVPVTMVEGEADRVREIRGEKTVVPFTFRADFDRFDELIKGYYHVRITGVMVVGETAKPGQDLFERTDDYYLYLKPRGLTDDDVRARNGWKPGAVVPRWIAMPSH
jgi:putative ABC transport system ATP-binding protein/macrolide transport system ATP-binding/permease protein/lipoprotein-releasing system ATP-binding protein